MSRNTSLRVLITALMLLPCLAAPLLLRAQASARDTVRLDVLQQAAEQHDKRAAQFSLLTQQSDLRLANIRNEWKPTVLLSGSAQYLSNVAGLSGAFSSALQIPTPFHDQYEASLTLREPLLDPTRARRMALETARLAESSARVESALFQQRQLVNDAFFAAQSLSVQIAVVNAGLADLADRLRVADERVTAGMSLPSEATLFRVEMLRRRQALLELRASQDATRTVLESLTGLPISANAVFADGSATAPIESPIGAAVASVFQTDPRFIRPEYEAFARAREAVEARIDVNAAQSLPRINLVARGGYGRPGLNPLGRDFTDFYTAGVQVEWNPPVWGRVSRDAEAERLSASMLEREEAAFTETLARSTIALQGEIRALEVGTAADDSIVVMHESIRREAQLRVDAGELTSTEYIARVTSLHTAQLDREARQIRLRALRARYRTTLGREVP